VGITRAKNNTTANAAMIDPRYARPEFMLRFF
jgi:hypothetical protein